MLTGVLAFLLAVILLLAIPITLDFRVSWPRAPRRDVELGWAFGLVHLRVPAGRPTGKEGVTAKQPRARPGTPRRKWRFGPLVQHQPFRRRITRFARDLWCAVHREDLELDVRLGLDDPADTGQLWAVLGPVSGILAGSRETSIRIKPDFTEENFQLNGSGRIRIVPLQVICLAAALLLSPSIWAGIGRARAPG